MHDPDIPIVAVIGGVGSGKSTVIRQTASQIPAMVIDADHIGHQVLTRPEIRDRLKHEFGDVIIDEHGDVNRRELGRLVFGGDSQSLSRKQKLETIVHPAIKQEIQNQIDRGRSPDNDSIRPEVILLDAAVILEAGWKDLCDSVVFLDTPDELRRQRVMEQRNWTEETWKSRENNQIALIDKKNAADHVIDNSGTVEQSGMELERYIRQLRRKSETEIER